MNTKHVLLGAAAGGVLAGIGFLAFHPEGKKLCTKLTSMGMQLAEDVLDVVRTNMTAGAVKEAVTGSAGQTQG